MWSPCFILLFNFVNHFSKQAAELRRPPEQSGTVRRTLHRAQQVSNPSASLVNDGLATAERKPDPTQLHFSASTAHHAPHWCPALVLYATSWVGKAWLCCFTAWTDLWP